MNFAQIKAIEKKNKERILQVCRTATEQSGIYVFFREENEIRYAYVGQAKKILTRLADHLRGYQHIDLSLKKHGLWSAENPTGWNIFIHKYTEAELDDREQEWIKNYASMGYQLRNKTAGGQRDGKFVIAETRPAKGYHDGLAQGYKNAQRDVAKLFDKHLAFGYAGNDGRTHFKPSIHQEKAWEKFNQFIQKKGENENE